MGTKSWIQLHSVYEFFKEEVKLVKRGENANDSGHVRECIFVNNNLKGIVKASMRDQTYNIEVRNLSLNKIKQIFYPKIKHTYLIIACTGLFF